MFFSGRKNKHKQALNKNENNFVQKSGNFSLSQHAETLYFCISEKIFYLLVHGKVKHPKVEDM